MDRNDTKTLKLYSPLTAELQIEPIDDAYYDEPDMEQLHGGDLVYFQEAILDGIVQEQLPGEAERGLMAYFHGPDSVNQKVESMKPTVEVVHGQLYGVAVCRIKGALTEAELSALKDYCTGQYADGWGESFEQRPRATGDGDLYVHFWQSKGFFLKTKQELERINQQKCGGTKYERAVLGAVDTTTPEYKAFEQKPYSAALERISQKRNVPHKSTQKEKEEMTR